MATPTTLVLGGTGKTGRRVAQRLTARGLPVRLGSRTGHPPFDWEDRRTWEPALQGMAQAYVSYYPDLAVPGAAATVAAFAALAAGSGVQRLVLLSGRGEEGALAAEQAVPACGAAWTILQATWFSQNFSEGGFLAMVQSGEVTLPAGDVPEPFVDADDIRGSGGADAGPACRPGLCTAGAGPGAMRQAWPSGPGHTQAGESWTCRSRPATSA